MSLYDDISIDYPLDLLSYIPDKWRSIARVEISAGGFQTKDLTKDLAKYHIDNCGYLYLLEKDDWEKNEDPILKKVDHHGYIRVYAPICIDEKNHFWLEYKLKYTDGKLVNAEMLYPTKEQIDELRLHTDV
jgi:hypothetical protein